MAAEPKSAPRKRSRRRGAAKTRSEPEAPSAELLLGRLDEVVRELEGGELPLEQALARFEEGVKLVRDGERLLASVEQRIEILLAEGETAPFADESDYADDPHPDSEDD